jgi:zinc/manganese transport system permease protein
MTGPIVMPMLSIFDYGFMQHAFMAATLVAVFGGILGYFVVLSNKALARQAL